MILQLKTGGFDSNFSYLAFEENSKEGFIIDPCGDTSIIEKAVADNNVKVKYVINTHGHRDHIEGNNAVLKATKAQLAIHEADTTTPAENVILLNGGETLKAGLTEIKIYHTPGHTAGSICIQFENGLFTGDTLFVDWCGYAEDKRKLYNSLQNIVRNFADNLIVYSGHDYGKTPTALLSHEKKYNPYLKIQDFDSFLNEYKNL